MPGFASRFVNLCCVEPALWHPDHSDGLLAATESIAAALDWPGFSAAQVKPLFDKLLRTLYQEDIRTKSGGFKLRWLKLMDAYLGDFVRGKTSKCSSDVREIEESVNNIEIDEDVPCDVCRSPNPEDGNEMIFCDSCNVCVHQTCYGVKRIPDGNWFCRPCEENMKPPCILCPNRGGALKCTSDERNWAHVSCALWIKEVTFGNPELVEPIIISSIPVGRWNLVCSLCRQKTGACTQCVVNRCTIAFHVTCAYEKRLRMEYKDAGADCVKLLSYCRKHSETKYNPEYKKETLKKRDTRNKSTITTPQKVRPHLQRKSASESITLVDSDSQSLDIDSTCDDSDQSYESSSFQSTDSESGVSGESSELSSSTQNSVISWAEIKREESDECFTPVLKQVSKKDGKLAREEENTHAETKTSLNYKILSDEQNAFEMQQQMPPSDDDSSPEILYEHFTDGVHAYSSPITKIEEISQSPINFTNAAQEAPQCKSELPTSTKETQRKEIVNLASSTKKEYVSAIEIRDQASCSTPSTSQQKPQESFFTHPHEAKNGQISKDHHAPSTEDKYQHLLASVDNALSLLKRLTEDKKRYRTKRKRIESFTNSEDSSETSSSDGKESKRIRKESIETKIPESSSSERNEHYNQFAKVITTVLKNIPPQIATTLEDKIITMCLKSHKQWHQIESKNR